MTGQLSFDTPAQPWCQRWTDRRPAWQHPGARPFTPDRYTVVPLPEHTARPFVERHHYAATYPAARLAYGLLTTGAPGPDATPHDGGWLVGVAVLSVPMSRPVLTNVFPTLEPYTESLELGRFVLTDATPANAESWMLARVFTLAARDGVRGVVSFSDPMPRRRRLPDGTTETVTPGHVGLIYQATNAVALGRGTARTLTYLPATGTVLPDRALSKLRNGEPGGDAVERRLTALGAPVRRPGQSARAWLPDALDGAGATRLRHPGNFRYAWPLGTRSERRATPPQGQRTPYPKPDRDRVDVPAA